MEDKMLVSVILPCLNEGEAAGQCVREAFEFLREHGLSGEVLLVDNGSEDDSAARALSEGARVVPEPRRGYGAALRRGLAEGTGDILLLADCDTTYDYADFAEMVRILAANEADLVIGDRFAGGMEPGAMPLSHKWGVRFLSMLARKRFSVQVRDFHCGIRGLRADALPRLELRTDGMEFATELIAEASRKGLRIAQVPAHLRQSRCERSSKLHAVRDGIRHVSFICGFPKSRF
jgi:glycosyltransferase involved in cell wall biosynthesis